MYKFVDKTFDFRLWNDKENLHFLHSNFVYAINISTLINTSGKCHKNEVRQQNNAFKEFLPEKTNLNQSKELQRLKIMLVQTTDTYIGTVCIFEKKLCRKVSIMKRRFSQQKDCSFFILNKIFCIAFKVLLANICSKKIPKTSFVWIFSLKMNENVKEKEKRIADYTFHRSFLFRYGLEIFIWNWCDIKVCKLPDFSVPADRWIFWAFKNGFRKWLFTEVTRHFVVKDHCCHLILLPYNVEQLNAFRMEFPVYLVLGVCKQLKDDMSNWREGNIFKECKNKNLCHKHVEAIWVSV